MTRERALKKLNKAILEVSELQDDEFVLILELRKVPKCHKCGALEGKGYDIGSVCGYTFGTCKCGYTYVDN